MSGNRITGLARVAGRLRLWLVAAATGGGGGTGDYVVDLTPPPAPENLEGKRNDRRHHPDR